MATKIASISSPMGAKDKKGNPNNGSIYTIIGAIITNPASAHAKKLISAHSWRIILWRRLAEKSAPLKPKVRPIEPKAKIKNAPSKNATATIFYRGMEKYSSKVPVINRITVERNTKNANLLFTRLLAVIGDA
jgi:hypothetical protein